MADGLLEDCRELLTRFESRQSVRYEVFSEIWREINFSFIHCGKKDANGRIQIVDYLFRIMSSYLSPSCTLIIRVGAVYALYGLYNTQLCDPKVKIRMTLQMWKELNELHEEIQALKHHDTDFIMRSLKNTKAFLFCAMPTQLAYGSREAIMNCKRENVAKVSADADKIIDRTCGVLERLHNAHSQYQEAKDSVLQLESSSDNAAANLDIASSTLEVDLASNVEEFHRWKQDQCQKRFMSLKKSSILMIPDDNIVKSKNESDVASTSNEENPEQSESSKRIHMLQTLREKSFRKVGKVSRSMRYLQPTTCDDDSDDDHDHEVSKKQRS